MRRAEDTEKGIMAVALDDGDENILRFGRMKLKAANPGFPDIVPREGQTVEIWGVVTAAIKQMPR